MARRNPKSIENEIEKNMKRITSLEEELKVSRSNEKSLQDEIQSLEKEIRKLKYENAILGKQLEEMDGKIKKLENENEVQKACKDEEDNVLILVQIGLTTQRNMCEYVLGKYFKNWRFYKFKNIDEYIEEDLKNPYDQEAARQRLKELKKKISWNQRLVDSLKNLNRTRIGIAHPKLSSEKIQQATEFFKEKGKLDEEVVANIKKLKEQWETSEALLQYTTSSTEEQDQRTRQTNGSRARKAAGGHDNPPSKKARICQTSSTEGQDQGSCPGFVSTTGQKQSAYVSRALNGRAYPYLSKSKS